MEGWRRRGVELARKHPAESRESRRSGKMLLDPLNQAPSTGGLVKNPKHNMRTHLKPPYHRYRTQPSFSLSVQSHNNASRVCRQKSQKRPESTFDWFYFEKQQTVVEIKQPGLISDKVCVPSIRFGINKTSLVTRALVGGCKHQAKHSTL